MSPPLNRGDGEVTLVERLRAEKAAHDFTGHIVNGERICRWCSGTPRECSLVFGPHCDKAPQLAHEAADTIEALVEALDRLDARVATCPIQKRAQDVCPKCKATSSESCGIVDRALYAFSKEARAALSLVRTGK